MMGQLLSKILPQPIGFAIKQGIYKVAAIGRLLLIDVYPDISKVAFELAQDTLERMLLAIPE